MSLLAWYPLIKDGKNQGLDGTDLTLRGTVSFTAGKLGNAATFSQNAANSYHKAGGFKLADKFSWTCWVKVTTTESTAAQFILSEGRDVGSIGLNLRCNQSGLIFLTSTAGTINIGTVTKDTWHHVAITVNSDDKIRTYLDGIESGTAIAFKELDYAQSDNAFVIGKMSYGYGGATTYFPFCGQVQDVRIYDHVLSKKEIKELSKGLCLHFPLDWGGNKNILPYTPVGSNPSEHNTELGKTVWVRSTTATGESYIYGGRTDIVEQSTKYTFSCWVWVNDYVKSVDYYWLSTNTTNKKTSTNFDNITSTTGKTYTPNQWHYVTWTFTTPANDYNGYIRIDNNGSKTEGTTAVLKVCNMKVEKGEIATPYIPHTSDTIYTSKGYGNLLKQDCSGYNRNATTVTNCAVSNTSPRGITSLDFTAKSSHFNFPNIPIAFTEFTMCIWAYLDSNSLSTSSNGTSNPIALGGNEFARFRLGTGTSATENTKHVWVYLNNGNPYFNYDYTDNLLEAWHHYVITFKGGTACKLYIDGALCYTQTTTLASLTCPSNSLWKLGEYGSNSETCDGKLSDFRFYATCLSDADIKELYQIPAQIDKSGKIYCNTFVEV